ncbi:zinc finger, CCHC-type containing protein [Tanacetum coccineum]|uniref:Zinc finger, CCHC-type containing protein n=1 Tax=Tanacetum coccineum TaxID=301880 RepID=A0ABQ5E8L5_9ASTR
METILAPHTFSSLFNFKQQQHIPKTNSITLTNTKTTISCNLKKDTIVKSLVPTNTNWLTNGLAALAISLALNFTPVLANNGSAAFASEFNVLNDGPPKESYVVDDAGVLSRVTRADLKNLLSDLEYRKKIRINFVTSKADAFEYADQVLERWDPKVLVTSQKEGAVTGGPEFIKAVGDTVLDATVSQNLPGLLSRFMQEPREQHMKAIRQVLRYVKGTKDYGITYKHNGGNKIYGYNDSSYGVNTQEGKGTTGIIFYYGESPISWSTQKQATVALSSCESEFIAATAAATQALWLKRLLSKLTHSQEEKVTIQVDNKSAIALMKNPVFHGRSKHIDTKYHFIRECVEREDIQVEFAIRMQIILEANGLWEMIEPNEKTQADNKKDKTAIAFLYQSLPEEQLLQITKHKTAKIIWDALKTRHIGEERVQQARLQTLKSEFKMLHMKEDDTIDTFIAKLTTIVNKAASLGHTLEDETLVQKLLNFIPDRYLQIVASIEQYSDLDEMTLEEAISRLKTYEERIKYKKGKQVDNQEKLMFTRHENKGKYFRGRGRGKHKFSQGRNHENFKEEMKDRENSHKNYKRDNFKKSSYDTSKLQCYKCKKIGHIAPNCPQRTKPNEQSNLVEEDLEPTLLMAILEDEEQKVSLHEEDVGYKETNMDSLWYLDNGASNHMTGVREHFKELDDEVSGKVRFRDGSYIEIKGKGLILIECDDEKQRIISHVYYILDLKSNLLSLGQFTEIGCKIVMEDDELRLYEIDNKIFMKVTRQRNRLYKENLRIGTPVCLLAKLKEDTWLWHARLGHLNFESLKSMAQRDLVHGIPTIKHTTQVCDVCLIGKHNRAPFPKKAKGRSTSHLDLVYGDLCRPITPPTPSGKKYIFLLVDDYSRYMWVYFLKMKDQAFDTFKEYKKSIENELRTTLKIVPIKALEDITLYEAIKRRKPNLENLRVFGCIAYAKVPSQHLTKLDDRSTKMVYLGNEQGSKAFRLFDPTTQRVCVSRDVKFKENETWDWKDYMSEHINDEPEWTDFKIGNLEVTNEHHDQGTQQIEEDNEFPNNDDNDYASPTRDSPSHSQTPHTPSTSSLQVNSQVTPNISTQSNYQSDNDSIQITNSPSHFDHTPLRGFRTLNDLYENTEELLLTEDEPKNYKEASSNQKWIEAMKVELDSINRNNT